MSAEMIDIPTRVHQIFLMGSSHPFESKCAPILRPPTVRPLMSVSCKYRFQYSLLIVFFRISFRISFW